MESKVSEEKTAAEDTKEEKESKSTLANDDTSEADVKVLLIGDSAVGKSKLVERYLMGNYNPRQLSTYALTTFRANTEIDGKPVSVDIWDTAGQERFQKIHPAYYAGAHACILVFDVTRKATYQHLADWYQELRSACGNVPCVLVANKIDVNYKVTSKKFKFSETHSLPFYFVSASDGTNVVRVFEQTFEEAVQHKARMQDRLARGELAEEDGDMAFLEEVKDTLRYFDEKESS